MRVSAMAWCFNFHRHRDIVHFLHFRIFSDIFGMLFSACIVRHAFSDNFDILKSKSNDLKNGNDNGMEDKHAFRLHFPAALPLILYGVLPLWPSVGAEGTSSFKSKVLSMTIRSLILDP